LIAGATSTDQVLEGLVLGHEGAQKLAEGGWQYDTLQTTMGLYCAPFCPLRRLGASPCPSSPIRPLLRGANPGLRSPAPPLRRLAGREPGEPGVLYLPDRQAPGRGPLPRRAAHPVRLLKVALQN
jgi:hypothetical protein